MCGDLEKGVFFEKNLVLSDGKQSWRTLGNFPVFLVRTNAYKCSLGYFIFRKKSYQQPRWIPLQLVSLQVPCFAHRLNLSRRSDPVSPRGRVEQDSPRGRGVRRVKDQGSSWFRKPNSCQGARLSRRTVGSSVFRKPRVRLPCRAKSPGTHAA